MNSYGSLAPKRRRWLNLWTGLGCGCGLVILAVLLVLVGSVIWFKRELKRNPELRQRFQAQIQAPACLKNLQEIGRALQVHQEDHGRYPDSLEELYPKYLVQKGRWYCPTQQPGKEPSKYEYLPPAGDAKPETPVITCPRHPGLILRLLENGEVKTERAKEIGEDND